MERQPLRDTLDQLHAELERNESLDVESREALEGLVGDIREALARSEGGSAHAGLIDRLREATRKFEESHPTLTAAVGRVADALSNMGI